MNALRMKRVKERDYNDYNYYDSLHLFPFPCYHGARSSPKHYDVLMLCKVIYLSVYGSSELMVRGLKEKV